MNFCLFGAGSWGTAMAFHLTRLQHHVTLVPRTESQATTLLSEKENKTYLPGIALPSSLSIITDPERALLNAHAVLFAVPSGALRSLCARIQPLVSQKQFPKCFFISLCKGLDPSSLQRPSALLEDFFPSHDCGTLSGPSYAMEVAKEKPTAIVLALKAKPERALLLQQALSGPRLRLYRTDDLIGVELGGCLKNVYAIGAGICDGLELGDNAKSAYLTRCLHEMIQLGQAFGGKASTFYGLSGIGDLVATCNGHWSRNRTFGEQVAKGMSSSKLLATQKTVVEGYWATHCFTELCRRKGLEAPILQEVYAVLFEEKNPLIAVESLMSRNLKEEATYCTSQE